MFFFSFKYYDDNRTSNCIQYGKWKINFQQGRDKQQLQQKQADKKPVESDE